MDNQAFEMHGENIPSSSPGKEGPKKEEGRKGSWTLLRIFLVCLLACVLSTAIGVLALSLLYLDTSASLRENRDQNEAATPPETAGKEVEPKFQFLNHLPKSKVFKYPGGEIQWARFRNDAREYQSAEELEFGKSLNHHHSKMTFGTLLIKSKGLRAPHWHFNANEHGYLLKRQSSPTAGTKVGCSVKENLSFCHGSSTVCVLQPAGGVDFIRTFQKQREDQAVNLPANLKELVQNATYVQSPEELVWQYFYDLQGSEEFPFPGGIFQWARYRRNGTGLSQTERIFSESLNKHENTLTLATLRIFSNGLGQPHFHFNANEMGYVISGCGQVGVTLSGVTANFNIGIGDVIFFPVGTQHYIKSVCDEDLLLLLAYSTGNQLETLRMRDYFHGTADHILAQLFFKKQEEFQKFPK
ncbi:LOW QUALITY PROTEIN: dynactin-associated protein [Heliangelus exortis]|uniref:LOW QUALITY PROTEIN: dynactin-associated protein n=1 Tax=Heliangelus exortis TaxID=472823 RepID=UPI003A8EC9A2